MKRKHLTVPVLILLCLSLLIFIFKDSFLKGFFENSLVPFIRLLPNSQEDKTEIGRLRRENQELLQKLSILESLQSENKALKDQFETQTPRSPQLLPAKIIGSPRFIPGVSLPEVFILDKGKKDGVIVGLPVVVGSSMIGRISTVSEFVSEVRLLSSQSNSFTAKTRETNAQGVVKGKGNGKIVLDNIVLSDTLKKDDIVVTYGDVSVTGNGLAEGLVVGKIISIEKKSSNLFQSAQIKSLVQIPQLSTVFVLVHY